MSENNNEELEITEEIVEAEAEIAEDFAEVEVEILEEDATEEPEEEEEEELFEPVDVDPDSIPDPPGIITAKSEEMYKKLKEAWFTAGKPRLLTALGGSWMVYDNGKRFVAKPGGWEQMYGSTSTRRMSGGRG